MKISSNNKIDINFRLTKLEEFCLSLSAHLEGERVLRKEEDQKCRQLCEVISNQIKEIKEAQPNESFHKHFISLKEQLMNIMDSKICEKMIENNNHLENQFMHIKSIEESLIKKQEIALNHYKYEMNNLNKRIDLLENSCNKRINEVSYQIEEIAKLINTMKIYNNDLGNKINEINNNISKLETDDIKNRQMLENNIKNIKINYKEKDEKNEIDLNNINENLSYLKNEIGSLSEKYLNEIEEIKVNLINQRELESKEILNFEKHLLGEYENFTKFMTNLLNKNIDKIKSMNEYLNGDVEIVKNKSKYIEEALLKLREDVFDSMDKNSKFILDKMKSHFNNQIGSKSFNQENEKEINEDINNNKNI